MYFEIEEEEKLRAEALASRFEKEILKILFKFRDINPITPKTISDHIDSELFQTYGSKLSYHLEKLCDANLVERKSAGKKKSFYNLSKEGVEFYKKLMDMKLPTEDIAQFLTEVAAPYLKGKSEQEIYDIFRTLISDNKRVASIESRKRNMEKAYRIRNN